MTDSASYSSAAAMDRLRQFLNSEMAMSHVYQPVMIRTLLEGGGAATRRQIASAFLSEDLSQLEYYERVVQRYPGPVLRRRGIVEYNRGVYRLAQGVRRLDEWQRAALIAQCDAKVAEFISARQAAIWNHRRANAEAVPGSVRWEVIKRAMGRCEACGISSELRAIEVDHIIPRARGGSNALSNLQALCYVCNAQKSDREATDFRAAHEAAQHREATCALCTAEPLAANELAVLVNVEGTPLLAPRRHAAPWRKLWQAEINALHMLEQESANLFALPPNMQTAMRLSGEGDIGHLEIRFT